MHFLGGAQKISYKFDYAQATGIYMQNTTDTEPEDVMGTSKSDSPQGGKEMLANLWFPEEHIRKSYLLRARILTSDHRRIRTLASNPLSYCVMTLKMADNDLWTPEEVDPDLWSPPRMRIADLC
jgi:hypothetical protein